MRLFPFLWRHKKMPIRVLLRFDKILRRLSTWKLFKVAVINQDFDTTQSTQLFVHQNWGIIEAHSLCPFPIIPQRNILNTILLSFNIVGILRFGILSLIGMLIHRCGHMTPEKSIKFRTFHLIHVSFVQSALILLLKYCLTSAHCSISFADNTALFRYQLLSYIYFGNFRFNILLCDLVRQTWSTFSTLDHVEFGGGLGVLKGSLELALYLTHLLSISRE